MIHLQKIGAGFAALDLGARDIYVAAAGAPVRRFGTFSADLRALAQWLREQAVQQVAMEATGVLWIQPHDYLQKEGFQVTLFHGAHARNLPGRKSDVQDCQWHAMLHSHGLLAPCFVPEEGIRRLRSYNRLREEHLQAAASHIQHMQRALDLMNVRLHQVISQLHGVSGLRIIEAILQGERNPEVLAGLCVESIRKKKQAEVVASLEGHWQEHHLFALRQGYEAYGFYQQQIAQCDQEITRALAEINRARVEQPKPAGRKVKKSRHHPPQVPQLYEQLLQACHGNDAQVLPAMAPTSWLKLIGELGTDLSHWKNEKHFTAWLGLSPGRHQSGKRNRRVVRRKTRAGQIFREAVLCLGKSKHCALGEFYRRIRARRGAPVAIVAAARKLAELYWRVMVQGLAYAETGLANYSRLLHQQAESALRRKAAKLGFALHPLTPQTPL